MSTKMYEHLGMEPYDQKRLIGFEIEVEGSNLPRDIPGWRITHDGSLKGEALEYVLRRAETYEGFIKCLDDFFRYTDKNSGVIINDSVRAGIHLHINIQHLTVTQLINFIVLSLIFEDLLIEYCGESRTGNLFCLRSVDAEWVLKVLQDVLVARNFMLLNNDDIRYCFINLKSILDHGSLEFRSLPTKPDKSYLRNWVDIILNIFFASLNYNSPREIISGFSGAEISAFRRQILGKYFDLLDFKDADKRLLKSMRMAQDVVFLGDKSWDDLLVEPKNNPFHLASNKNMLLNTNAPPKNKLYSLSQPAKVRFAMPQEATIHTDDGIDSAIAVAPPDGLRNQDALDQFNATWNREAPIVQVERMNLRANEEQSRARQQAASFISRLSANRTPDTNR